MLSASLVNFVQALGAKLVRQAASKTNDLAGDEMTTSVVLAQVLRFERTNLLFPQFLKI